MQTKKLFLKRILAFVGILIFVLLAVGCDPNAWKTEDNRIMAYIMMRDYVKKRLKSPSTAEFPSPNEGGLDHHVTALGNQTYIINSYVDAQNGFGATIRTEFIGKIKQISDTRWQLISLNLLN